MSKLKALQLLLHGSAHAVEVCGVALLGVDLAIVSRNVKYVVNGLAQNA
ncbi:MAG: hypothetical protein HYX68_00120, partial [Planctomycetes bacterium]|nr:hypothetical protein [Planctomycetota bacterium]